MNNSDLILSNSSSTTTTSQHYLKLDFDNNLESSIKFPGHNYSLLISKLEKLAFGNNDESSTLIPPELHHVLNGGFQQHLQKQHSNILNPSDMIINDDASTTVIHTITDAEYSRFVSDIWIGIVLTLLILSIIFFICSCFLYHKFQQWKNSYRTNNSEPEIIRRYDLDVESLPSYTLVSGLPTYDDALEQFRKAGILIQQPSCIKIFEDYSSKIKKSLNDNGEILIGAERINHNDTTIRNDNINEDIVNNINDNISINSCICGGGITTNSVSSGGNCSILTGTTTLPSTQSATTLSTMASIIELNPEQLKMLSQKRLSLQITFNSGDDGSMNNSTSTIKLPILNRNGKIDLYREVNRNNLLRSHEYPQIHRSTSSLTNERSILARRLMRNIQHRGSLA